MIQRLFFLGITVLRVGVGAVVVKVGLDVIRENGLFLYVRHGVGTGLFVILIGAYIIFSSLAKVWFGQEK